MFIYDGAQDRPIPITDHTIAVTSSNRLASGDNTTLRVKGRRDFSLFFVENGKMTFDDTVLNKNQIWIYPPNVRQEYVSYKKDNVTYYYLHFTGNNVEELVSSLNIPLLKPLDFLFDKEIFEKIRKNSVCDDALSKLKVEISVLELLSLLAKIKPAVTRENAMEKVIDQMHHSYFLPYDAEKFAKVLSLSQSRFNHLFKETVGIAPQKYYNNVKMENAAVLLTETQLSVSEIARKTGFSDAFYFGQSFRKVFGVSPTQYRKK